MHSLKLVFSFHKNKTVDPWCGLMHWFQDSCLEHLINFLLEALLKMNWYWVARCLFGGNAWVKLYTVRWTRKLASSFKHIRIVCKYLVFACYQLVYMLLLCHCCDLEFEWSCLVFGFEQTLSSEMCELIP